MLAWWQRPSDTWSMLMRAICSQGYDIPLVISNPGTVASQSPPMRVIDCTLIYGWLRLVISGISDNTWWYSRGNLIIGRHKELIDRKWDPSKYVNKIMMEWKCGVISFRTDKNIVHLVCDFLYGLLSYWPTEDSMVAANDLSRSLRCSYSSADTDSQMAPQPRRRLNIDFIIQALNSLTDRCRWTFATK